MSPSVALSHLKTTLWLSLWSLRLACEFSTATFAAKQTPQDSLKEKKFVGTVVVGEAGTNVGQ